jgi:hypothetical protein
MADAPRNPNGDYVVDADGHVCEPADLWTKNLPSHLADQGIRLRWNEATGYDECLVEDKMSTDRGLVGLGNAGESYENFGQGRHYEDLNPAGFDPHERVKVLDAEGIDVSVMYPGLGLKLGGIEDPELAVWSCRVYNDWLAEWCDAAPDRLKGAGALPCRTRQARPRRRTGSRTSGWSAPSSAPTRTSASRSTNPTTSRCGRRSRRPGSRSACTSPGSWTCRARHVRWAP